MKVSELIEELKLFPRQDDEIVITSMDDDFICSEFEVRSFHEDENASISVSFEACSVSIGAVGFTYDFNSTSCL